eukprot:TCONS_00034613-protein
MLKLKVTNFIIITETTGVVAVSVYTSKMTSSTKYAKISPTSTQPSNIYGLKLKEKNKHSKLLLNVAYQPNFTNQEKADWLESFDRIVGTAILDWTGNVVITGDFNIDLLSNSQIKDSYLETLRSFDLTQHVK